MMYVYSGECRFCEVGIPTDLVDVYGEKLFTGDIVITYTEEYISGLSVVVADKYKTYTVNGREEVVYEPKDDFSSFIMGLKEVDFSKEDCEWSIKKVKSYKDVINGEHWKDWGFNYKEK